MCHLSQVRKVCFLALHAPAAARTITAFDVVAGDTLIPSAKGETNLLNSWPEPPPIRRKGKTLNVPRSSIAPKQEG